MYKRYKNYKIIYLEEEEYIIDNIVINTDNYIRINDLLCVYLDSDESKLDKCKIVYIDNELIKKDIILNENIDLIIHDSNRFTNKTLEQIYSNWIDTYLINKNKRVLITFYTNYSYKVEEFSI